jgi:hypothetical protein
MPAVRVSEHTYRMIQDLAGGGSMQAVITQAVENLRRQRMLEEANAAFAALRQDPVAWEQEREERERWDEALGDGLEED